MPDDAVQTKVTVLLLMPGSPQVAAEPATSKDAVTSKEPVSAQTREDRSWERADAVASRRRQ